MGRMFYQIPKQTQIERSVHFIKSERGTVVLAMREPVLGERGYDVGVDFTIRDAVRELLADWDVDGPGWLQSEELIAAKWSRPQPGDETFTVTILAAYSLDDGELAKDDEQPSMGTAVAVEAVATVITRKERFWYVITSGEHDGAEFLATSEDDAKCRAHLGERVVIRFYPADQFAKFIDWTAP